MMKKSERTAENIKAAALKLFCSKGYKAVSMNDVCLAVGMSRGGVYRYYNGTRELFEEIINGFFMSAEQEFFLAISNGETYEECLNNVLNRFAVPPTPAEGSVVPAIFEYCKVTGSDFMNEAFKGAKRVWGRFIAERGKAGAFNNVNTDAMADAILFSYIGARMCSSIMRFDDSATDNVINFLRGILLDESTGTNIGLYENNCRN